MSFMTRIALALLVAFLGPGCSVSKLQSNARPAAPPLRHVLPNGARVVIQEHTSSDVVALQLWVKAGGRDETASELGVAHYLEHMRFKGTPSRPRGFIDREVDSLGMVNPAHREPASFVAYVATSDPNRERAESDLRHEIERAADVTRVARRYLATPTIVVVRPPP